jgi:hypothetical protein
MNTTLRMKIVFRTPVAGAGKADPESPRPALPALIDREVVNAATPAADPMRKRGGSTDPREFLAMHARLKREQARTRRWKIVGAAISMAAVATAGAIILWARHNAAVSTGVVAASSGVAPSPARAELAAPAPGTPVMLALVTPPVPMLDPAAASPSDAAVAATVAPSEARGRCQEQFEGRRWHEAIDSCGLAFEERPDAATALRVGHAHWSTGHVAEAGLWANKAVELGTEDADAFVLIGHSEREAGHLKSALSAYRRYLRASPRGWHARNVRAAVHDLKQKLVDEGGLPGQASVEPSESAAAAPL